MQASDRHTADGPGGGHDRLSSAAAARQGSILPLARVSHPMARDVGTHPALEQGAWAGIPACAQASHPRVMDVGEHPAWYPVILPQSKGCGQESPPVSTHPAQCPDIPPQGEGCRRASYPALEPLTPGEGSPVSTVWCPSIPCGAQASCPRLRAAGERPLPCPRTLPGGKRCR